MPSYLPSRCNCCSCVSKKFNLGSSDRMMSELGQAFPIRPPMSEFLAGIRTIFPPLMSEFQQASGSGTSIFVRTASRPIRGFWGVLMGMNRLSYTPCTEVTRLPREYESLH